MLRWLQVLSFTFTVIAISIFSASCSSSSQAQIRVVHAVPNEPALDFNFNSTKVISNLAFGAFQPTTGYVNASAGNVTVQAFPTGTTTNSIFGSNGVSATLNGSAQYTLVAAGPTGGPSLVQLTDNNTAPASGNIEFRIVHASSTGPTSVDVYIVPPGTDIINSTPQISALTFQQGSSYQSLAFAPNGYSVIVTSAGFKDQRVNQTYMTPTGSIRTLVLIDDTGTGTMSQTPLLLSDLG